MGDLVNTDIRVNRAFISQVGSALVNAGVITIRVGGAGAIQASIPLGKGATQGANRTVPLNKKLNITRLDYSVGQVAGQDVETEIKLWAREFGKGWHVIVQKESRNGGNTVKFNDDELEFGPRTDIKVTGAKLFGTGDATIECSYTFLQYAG